MELSMSKHGYGPALMSFKSNERHTQNPIESIIESIIRATRAAKMKRSEL